MHFEYLILKHLNWSQKLQHFHNARQTFENIDLKISSKLYPIAYHLIYLQAPPPYENLKNITSRRIIVSRGWNFLAGWEEFL